MKNLTFPKNYAIIFIETRKSTIDMVKLIYPEILTDNDIYSRRIS